ncbi:MAG: AAA family ATPase, partial [Verrucomicrobiae bacterium]|nr:AAA family ATPase [Verrucomicrobiae bacterium]
KYLISKQTMLLGMLTGEIGCGKSMVRQALVSQLPPDRVFVVQFENSGFHFTAHLRRVVDRFGLSEYASDRQGVYELYELVAHCMAQLKKIYNQHLVLLFDEAQDLTLESLCQIKSLTNLNERGEGSLTVILIGQPELRDVVKKVPAVDQRITLRYHLKPMAAEDIDPYLRHRLSSAGVKDTNIFTPDACERIFFASRGIPREINRIAGLALEVARNRNLTGVDGREILMVVEDLRRHQNMPTWNAVPI